jgi:hypothetical protein
MFIVSDRRTVAEVARGDVIGAWMVRAAGDCPSILICKDFNVLRS